MKQTNDSNPPLPFLVGKGLVGIVEKFYNRRISEYEAWREVSDSTNFE